MTSRSRRVLPDALQALEWAPLAENFFLAVYSLLVLNILVFEIRVPFGVPCYKGAVLYWGPKRGP